MDRFYLYFVLMKKGSVMKTIGKLQSAGLCAAVFCAAALAGCGGVSSGSAEPAVRHAPPAGSVLKVGTDPTFPPFEYYQEQTGSYTGFDLDLIEAVAKTAGYEKVEFVNTPMNEILRGLNEKKYDAVISCLSITDERQKEAAFTAPYADSSYVAVTAKGVRLSGKDELKERKLSVKSGSVAETIAHSYTDNVESCATAEDALRHVISGASDVFISDRYMAAFFATNGYGGKIEIQTGVDLGVPSKLAIAVRKDDEALLAQLNESLATFSRSKPYEQMKTLYFGNYL